TTPPPPSWRRVARLSSRPGWRGARPSARAPGSARATAARASICSATSARRRSPGGSRGCGSTRAAGSRGRPTRPTGATSPAAAGRVARLWVDASRSLPGRLDPATGRVELDAGDGDVLDALCEAVLARGGEVIPVAAEQLPSPTGAAAELR